MPEGRTRRRRRFRRGSGRYNTIHGEARILVTFDEDHEQEATYEALRLLKKYSDRLYPVADSSGSSDDDFASGPSSEDCPVADCPKASVSGSSSRQGLALVKLMDSKMDPIVLMREITRSIRNGSEPTPLYCIRMVPFQVTCPATRSHVLSSAAALLRPFQSLPAFGASRRSFGIAVDSDGTDALRREDTIVSVARLIPQHHRIDLSNPDLTIIIHAVQGLCGLSIISQYSTFGEFVLQAARREALYSQLPTDAAHARQSPADRSGGLSPLTLSANCAYVATATTTAVGAMLHVAASRSFIPV